MLLEKQMRRNHAKVALETQKPQMLRGELRVGKSWYQGSELKLTVMEKTHHLGGKYRRFHVQRRGFKHKKNQLCSSPVNRNLYDTFMN